MVAKLVAVIVALSACAFATNNCSISLDFRSTSGYVTDPSTGVPVIATDGSTQQTKTSSGGCSVTYQWMTNISGGDRDRSASVDPRLAGINQFAVATTIEFRVTGETAGSYSVAMAIGDATNNQCIGVTCTLTVKDGVGGTSLLVATASNVLAGNFYDASSTNLTASAWPGSNTPETITTTGTTISFVFTVVGSTSVNFPIANISLTPSGGGGPAKHCTLSLTGAGPC